MDVLSGTDHTIWVDFLSSTDDLVVPDINTVTYSVFSAVGLRLSGPIQLTPEAEATGVSIVIDESLNAIGAGRQFDQRTVIVSWMADGAGGARRVTYRLIPFPIYQLSESDIRNVIGLGSDELPDDAIDLYSGYLTAGSLFSDRATLDTALTSGSLDAVIANRVIAYTIVLGMMPALSQRVLQSKTDGALKTDRLKTIDLVALAAMLSTRRQLDLGLLIPDTTTTAVTSTLILLTTPAIDPVTGNAPATGT